MEVLRTGFRIDGITFRLCPDHSFHTLLIGQVDDVELGAGGLSPVDGPLISLTFHPFRTGEVVIPGRGLALRDELFCQGVDHLVVLCVDADQGADFLGLVQYLKEHTVSDAEVVDHEHLERGDAVFYRVRHRIQQLAVHILDADMERVVTAGVRRTKGVAALDGIYHGFPKIL